MKLSENYIGSIFFNPQYLVSHFVKWPLDNILYAKFVSFLSKVKLKSDYKLIWVK